jgi:raffinose/stachyose/melibiose transport system permease protein
MLSPVPTSIIVLRPFFRSIPAELEEAAALDGCGPFRFFYKIALPMSRPVLATVLVLAIVASWNAFLLPLLVLNDPDMWTLPLGVTNYSTQHSSDTAGVLAFTSLSMVPALVFYVIAERQIESGLAKGALKG